MKKYPSYTTITNPNNQKKHQIIPKYERPSPVMPYSNANTNINNNNNSNKDVRHGPLTLANNNNGYITNQSINISYNLGKKSNNGKDISQYIQKDGWANSNNIGNISRKYF